MSSIVVVEDEPMVLEMVREMLQGQGFTVRGIRHPGEVAQLNDQDPALFLIDMLLPDMSGIRVAQLLRESGYPYTPMVAMSASKIELLFASRSGLFQETLTKPFEMDELTACAHRYADNYVVASQLSSCSAETVETVVAGKPAT